MMAPGAMPDAQGNVSLSLYNGAHLEEFLAAGRDPDRVLIVEASPHFPRTLALDGHEHHLDLDDIDVVVYTDEQPTFCERRGRPRTCKIAEFAASLHP